MRKSAKLINNKNLDLLNKDDYCMISYEPFDFNKIEEKPIIKLLCNHTFYYDNIIMSYIITNKSSNNYIGKRICPYCRKYGGFLPHVKDNYIKGIHLRNKIYTIKKRNLPKSKFCTAKIQNGPNKGTKCGYRANIKLFSETKMGYKKYYCGKHKNMSNLYLELNENT